jgi:hypothetical protein
VFRRLTTLFGKTNWRRGLGLRRRKALKGTDAMMAPKYERGRMLEQALQLAIYELADPIDRIEVIGGQVVAWAGGRRLKMSFGYEASYGERGEPMPGSGTWRVWVDGKPR